MKITLLVPGRFKSTELKNLVEMYATRTTRFCPMELVELSLKKSSQTAEEDALLRYLDERSTRVALVVLDEKGKTYDSKGFAAKLTTIMEQGVVELVVAVGGPHGYSDTLKHRAVLSWSLSPLTMAHELAATVAAEQLYRALTIQRGHPYHNE